MFAKQIVLSVLILIFYLISSTTYALNINSCQSLNAENETYTLTQNITSTSTCLTISAENITVDCAGYNITYGTIEEYTNGIYSENYNYNTIKNCTFISTNTTITDNYAIYFVNSSFGIISNNYFNTAGNYSDAVGLYSNSDNVTVINNEINISGNLVFSIYVKDSLNANISRNNITIASNTEASAGISVRNSNNSVITNNNILSFGDYSDGLIQTKIPSLNTLFENNTINQTGIDSYGINIANDYKYFLNAKFNLNTITTSGYGGYGIYIENATNITILNSDIITFGETANGVDMYCPYYHTINCIQFINISDTHIKTMGYDSYGLLMVGAGNNTLNSVIINSTEYIGVYSYSSSSIIFTDSTIITPNNYSFEFFAFNDDWDGSYNKNTYINTTFDKNNVMLTAGFANAKIDVFWHLDVYVNDTLGNSVENANITGWDINTNKDFEELTNASGQISRQTLLEYEQIGATKTFETNYTINASKNGVTSSKEINLTESKSIYLSIEINPITITIQSPTNTSYNTQSIWFNTTVNENADWCGYSIDGNTNITMTNSSGNWNKNNASMTEGSHNVIFSCNDTMGNMNNTNTVYFTIDTTELNIYFVNPTPYNNLFQNKNYAYINVTATDSTNTTAFIDWDRSLVGWWRFNHEAGENDTFTRDWSSWGNNGTMINMNTGVDNCTGDCSGWTTNGKFGYGMQFDGVNDYIDGGTDTSLDTGTTDFTISVQVSPSEEIDQQTDQIGDILSKFDQTTKNGINLGFSGSRNLFFGIDDNKSDTEWVEVAPQLAGQTYIYSLTVYNGKLYGGTYPNGKLFEWNGVDAWVEVAPQFAGQIQILSLAVYNGKLYGGTVENGKLFEWNGVDAWVEVAPQLAGQTHIYSLAVYNGKLYGSTHPNGKLFEWNGVDAWVEVAPQLAGQTYTWPLAVYNGKLYGGTYPNGKLFEWNGVDAWVEVAPQFAGQIQILSLTVYNGKLYGGTAQNGKLFEWNGVDAWVEVAPQLAGQTHIISIAVYNGKLYGSTHPNGKLFEWNGVDAWVEVAPQLAGQTHIYSLAVYNGKLYGGTAPNGKLFEWKTGVAVSHNIPSTSSDIVAVRETSNLKLYVDGILVATSDSFNSSDYNLTNTANMLIGLGQHDYFNGVLDEIKIWNRALSPEEIKASYNTGLYRLENNFTNLSEGAYTYTAYAQDLAGNVNQTETRTLTIDETNPTISFTYPTPEDLKYVPQNWIYINTSIYDAISPDNITTFIDWNRSLVGWWRFNHEAGENDTFTRDWSTYGNNGTMINMNTGVDNCTGDCSGWTTNGKFGYGMQFDGVNDYIDGGNGASLNTGTTDFTISTQVSPSEEIDQQTDQIGDILSKFDQTTKNGINLGFSDSRDLFFGIDDNKSDTAWAEVAPQLAGQTHMWSLAIYNGKLYGGTAPNGKLFEWNGVNAWVEVAPQLVGQAEIKSLAIYNGKLYGGTVPNGKLFEWNGVDAWVEVAPQLAGQTYIRSLAVYNGKLYGSTGNSGKLFEWNGVDAWVEVAPQLAGQTYIWSLAVYNGKLYGGTYPDGKLFEWNGVDAWVEVAPQLAGQIQILSLTVYNGKLYGGTAQNGKLFEWNGVNAWVEVAPQLAGQTYIRSLAVYNGKLYGSTGNSGKLFEWNGVDAWVEVAPQLAGQTFIISLAVYNGKLYGGTAPNGKLLEWKTGVAVSHNIPSTSSDIVAVREASNLKLYVDGILVATSDSFNSSDYDLTNTANMLIGLGQHDYFNGVLDEVKIWNRALSPEEIKASYNTGLYRLENNFTNLSEGAYTYTAYAQDLAGNVNQTETRTLTVDETNPTISFTYPTPEDLKYVPQNWIYINTSIYDAISPDNITTFIDWNRSLVGWWRFNHEAGENDTFTRDWSTYGNNGTMINMNTGVDNCTGDCSGWTTNGKFGYGMQFDGVNDYVRINKNPSLNNANFTWSMWVESNSTAIQGVIGKRSSSGSNWVRIYLRNNGYYEFDAMVDGGAELANIVVGPITLGSRNHIVATYDGNVARLYLNGVLGATSTVISDMNGALNEDFEVGFLATNRFNGTIDEVKIWNRALSPEEIKASYNTGLYRLENNFTNLSEGAYTYTAYAQDLAGNVNQTETRTLTIDTTLPTITIFEPTNTITNDNTPHINATQNDLYPDTMWYSIDGGANIYGSWTTQINTNTTTLTEGTHNITIYANDTSGNQNQATTYFEVDVLAPVITIISPLVEFHGGDAWFKISLDQRVSWCGYSLDGAANITMTNTTITNYNKLVFGLTNGAHTIIYWCNNTYGMYSTKTVNTEVTTGFVSIKLTGSGFTPTNDIGDTYAAASIGNTVVGLIHSKGEFKNLSSSTNLLKLNQGILSEGYTAKAYIVYTKGDVNTIENRINYIKNGNIEKMPNPSFAFSINKRNKIQVGLEYDDLDIVQNLKIRPGFSKISINNGGFSNNKIILNILRAD